MTSNYSEPVHFLENDFNSRFNTFQICVMSNLKRSFQDSRSDEGYDFSKIQKKKRRAGPRTDDPGPTKSTVKKDSNIPGPSKLQDSSDSASDGVDDATHCIVEDIRSEVYIFCVLYYNQMS